MKTPIRILLCFFCGSVAAKESERTRSFFQSNTPLRVLLHASPRGAAVRNLQRTAVRINGTVKHARLNPGTLALSLLPGGFLRVVRVPYPPLRVQSFEMLGSDDISTEWNGRRFRGGLWVTAQADKVWVVNRIPLETYVAATVGGEMNPTWPLEALKAQAVAARSYALYRQHHPRGSFFDIDSTTEDQVYLGTEGETPLTRKAVQQTRGVYLALQGQPTKAYYHSRCGGTTERAESVWGAAPGVSASVPCTYCRKHPFTWTASWTPREFLGKVGLPEGSALNVHPTEVAEDGRVRGLIVSNGESRQRLTAESLRRKLGYMALKSNRFTFSRTRGQIHVQGTGHGHGVGMCQWGAKHLAEQGRPYDAILHHYYPQGRLALAPVQKGLDSQPLPGVRSAHVGPELFRLPASGGEDSALPRFP